MVQWLTVEMMFLVWTFSVLFALLCMEEIVATNFTLEDSYDEDYNYWDQVYQARVIGIAPPTLKGRGIITEFRIRPAGSRNFIIGRRAGVNIFLRQAIDGELGEWRQAAFLEPDDLPGPDDPLAPISTMAFVGGMYASKGFDDLGVFEGRDGTRLQLNKHAVSGNPETKNILMLSAFGYTYTETAYKGTGAVYLFTGEYYHWTQVFCFLFS